MKIPNIENIETHLLTIIHRWKHYGKFIFSTDGHLFFQPCSKMANLRGALDMKKESAAIGAHIIVRPVKFRPKHSRYARLPWFQVYVLPIVKKTDASMTAAERANMELNTQAMRLAHAVERDPEQAALYHQLHAAHIAEYQANPSCPPAGYNKFYPNFYGFVFATIRRRLATS